MAARWMVACALALLAACGQKGTLRLPDDASGQVVTPNATAPADAAAPANMAAPASATAPAVDNATASDDQSEEENSSRPRQ